MTFERESVPIEEWKNLLENYCQDYRDGVFDEEEFRKRLLKLGMSATDIQDEVNRNKPA